MTAAPTTPTFEQLRIVVLTGPRVLPLKWMTGFDDKQLARAIAGDITVGADIPLGRFYDREYLERSEAVHGDAGTAYEKYVHRTVKWMIGNGKYERIVRMDASASHSDWEIVLALEELFDEGPSNEPFTGWRSIAMRAWRRVLTLDYVDRPETVQLKDVEKVDALKVSIEYVRQALYLDLVRGERPDEIDWLATEGIRARFMSLDARDDPGSPIKTPEVPNVVAHQLGLIE